MNDSQRGAQWRSQAEKLLLSLRDIVGASLTLSPDGVITEISILAEGHRPPKQIVRDVRSALRAEYQLDVDYRKVSVAQKSTRRRGADPPTSPPPVEPGFRRPDVAAPTVLSLPAAQVQEEPVLGRLRFGGVTTSSEPAGCRVRVELALGNRDAVGEAEGPNARGRTARLVAEACLDAVDRFLDDGCQLSLSDLQTVRLGGEDVVLVGVQFSKDRSDKALVGSCPLGHDLPQSVVYATLSALNRLLGRLRYREPVEFELRPTTIP